MPNWFSLKLTFSEMKGRRIYSKILQRLHETVIGQYELHSDEVFPRFIAEVTGPQRKQWGTIEVDKLI
jgi:hypothetical protein